MADASQQSLADWVRTLGNVLPPEVRSGLRGRILSQGISGYEFSILVNQHELINLGVPGMTQTMATKVRKCWHSDFPKTEFIIGDAKPSHRQSSEFAEDRLLSPRAGRNVRHHTTGSIPTSGSGYGNFADSPSVLGTARQQSSSHILMQVELLRSALDCVAERAALDRQEMYLWVNSVVPHEIWQPLWDGVTNDLLRQQREPRQVGSSQMISSRGIPRAPQESGPTSGVYATTLSHDVSSVHEGSHQHLSSESSPSSVPRGEIVARLPAAIPPFPTDNGNPAQASEPTLLPEEQMLPRANEPARMLAELPAAAHERRPRAGSRSPEHNDQLDSPRSTPSERSFVPEDRSDVETVTTQAMSAWPSLSQPREPNMSPLDLAEWLRMLSPAEIAEEPRKAIARRVLDEEIDSQQFCKLLEESRWGELGIGDERDGIVLRKLLRMKEREELLAVAARRSATVNRFHPVA